MPALRRVAIDPSHTRPGPMAEPRSALLQLEGDQFRLLAFGGRDSGGDPEGVAANGDTAVRAGRQARRPDFAPGFDVEAVDGAVERREEDDVVDDHRRAVG